MADEKKSPSDAPKRAHRATYSRDKKQGGYLIRVEGPHAARFAGRTVPVIRRDGSESEEILEHLIWTGLDQKTNAPVALYSFLQKAADEGAPEVEF